MKSDRPRKEGRMGEHLPNLAEFRGSSPGETDLQFRRVLAAEVEKLRDRLADFIAGTDLGAGQEAFAAALRQTAALKVELSPPSAPAWRGATKVEEERLLEIDVVLLQNLASLHTPLESMETALTPEERKRALDDYLRGLTESLRLFRQRENVPRGEGEP